MANDLTARLTECLQPFVDSGLGGIGWGVALDGSVVTGTLGVADPPAARRPMPADTIFRIASVSKPIGAIAALRCVADGLIGLDDSLDVVLPELAGRLVQVDPTAPIEGPDAGPTVAADRPLTLRDVLAHRCGYGMDFDFSAPQPVLEAMWALGVGPAPTPPNCGPDEYLARLAALPLADQPGTRWRYHCGSDIASVVVERLRGERLDVVLARDVFGPLGMVDTSFVVPASKLARLGNCRMHNDDGELVVWDEPTGRWANTPEFFSGATGLVSTVEDLLRFGQLLIDGGRGRDGAVVLPSDLLDELCRDQLTDDQRALARINSVDDSLGWGLGLAVQAKAEGGAWPDAGVVLWDGGLGARWLVDRDRGVCAVLLLTDAFTSPEPPLVLDAFTQCVGELTTTD